jgi:intracellular multiplication protein IcmK
MQPKSLLISALAAFACMAQAQGGIGRVAPSAPVQAAATPQLPVAVPQPPSAAAPGQTASMAPPPIPGATPGAGQMPLPGGPLPAPLNLRQEALERIAPLTPEEVLELRKELKRRTEAMSQSLEPLGKPTRRVLTVDLSPGATPPVVRTAVNQGGVVSFVDATGRPWPVLTVDNYNQAGFDVAAFGPNGVSIGVKSASARATNMAVLLEGMSSPITFTVTTGQSEIDYSVEMQLPRYIPGQPAPVGAVEQMRSLGAADLMNFLLNTPPKDARALTSDTPTVVAWQVSPERMIVRTDALVASPAWQRRQSSTTGVSVYDLPLSPRIVVAAQGQILNVRLSGFAATKEQR